MKKTVLQKRRLKFLNDTVDFYKQNHRCLKKGTKSCLYVSTKNGKTIGCAIGRHIRSKKLCRVLDELGGVPSVFARLPKPLKYYGEDFLDNIQNLHDISINWNNPTHKLKTLTEDGVRTVAKIKLMFNL